MKIAHHMIGANHAFMHRDEQITHLDGRTAAFDKNTGALHGGGIHLARMGLKRTHQIQVNSCPKQVAVEQGGLRRSAGAEHIGFSGTSSGIRRNNGQACLGDHFLRELAARACVSAANQDLLKAADPRNHLDMRPRLPASSEYSQTFTGSRARNFVTIAEVAAVRRSVR